MKVTELLTKSQYNWEYVSEWLGGKRCHLTAIRSWVCIFLMSVWVSSKNSFFGEWGTANLRLYFQQPVFETGLCLFVQATLFETQPLLDYYIWFENSRCVQLWWDKYNPVASDQRHRCLDSTDSFTPSPVLDIPKSLWASQIHISVVLV